MTDQLEALRVAAEIEHDWADSVDAFNDAIRLLREQHAEIERLRAECDRLRELAALYINEICRFDKERMS
jgi:hypothetical protein